MKKLIFLCLCLSTPHLVAAPQFFGNNLSLEDLSQLSPQGVESLKESEFEVFEVSLILAAAKRLESQAAEALKKSKSNLKSTQAAIRSVELELKAATVNQDQERIATAEQSLAAAQRAHDIAKIHVDWKSKELNTQDLVVKKNDLELDLAKCKRDIERIDRLLAEQIPAAKNYSRSDLEKKKSALEQKIQETADRIKKGGQEADALRANYEMRTRG